MARKQTLIHLHGSTRLADASLLNQGEIAVTHAATKAETELAVKTKVDGTDVLVYIPSLDKVTGAIATAKSGAEATAKGYTDDAQSAAEATAQSYTDGVKTNLQGQIDALSNKVGTTDVAAQIQAAVAAEAEIARAAEKANADAIDAIEADYLKSTDKTELNNLITGLTETVNTNEADIEAKMTAEIARATKAEGDLQDAIDAIEADYLTSTDKTELQNAINTKVAQDAYDAKVGELEGADETNAKAITAHTANSDIHVTAQQKTDWQAATDAINAFMDAENVGTEVVDTLKEIQDYINTDGAAADEMTKNIAANADAIDAIEADYLTSTDKTELQNAINTKVAQTDYNAKVAELEQADTNNATAIANEKKRAEEAEEALQNAIDAIAGEGGSLADTLQAAKDYTNGLLGTGFTTGNTVAAAIAAEKTRAEGAEKANADAIDAIEADYLTSTDKTELQGAINDVDTAYKAADTAFTQALDAATLRIKALEDADYVKEVSVQTTWDNKITVTKDEGVVTLNFDNMVIDCGEY